MPKLEELEAWNQLNQKLKAVGSTGIELTTPPVKTWSKVELELLGSIFLRGQFQAKVAKEIVLRNESLLRDFLSFIDTYDVVRK